MYSLILTLDSHVFLLPLKSNIILLSCLLAYRVATKYRDAGEDTGIHLFSLSCYSNQGFHLDYTEKILYDVLSSCSFLMHIKVYLLLKVASNCC